MSVTTTTTSAANTIAAPATGRRWSALAGILAVGAAVATGELLAGLLPGVPSPLLSVAQFIVDHQPPGAKDFVVGIFGTNDKAALQVFVVVVALAIGAILGIQSARRPSLGATVIGAFAGVGFLASLSDPQTVLLLALAAAAAETVVGSWVLGWLLRALPATAAVGALGGSAGAGSPAERPRKRR